MRAPWLYAILLAPSLACTPDDASEATSAASASAGTSSESTGEPGSESTGEPGSESTGEPGSESTGEPGSESTDESGSESTGESGSESTGETGSETGEPPDPVACPAPAAPVQLGLDGFEFTEEGAVPYSDTYSDTSCDLPPFLTLSIGLEDTIVLGQSQSCGPGEHEYEFTFAFDLPNNNWELAFHPEVFDYGCKDVYLYSEPAGDDSCRLARVDIVDPDSPDLPVYSVAGPSPISSSSRSTTPTAGSPTA